jgi:lysophospholipase L1-like esterase
MPRCDNPNQIVANSNILLVRTCRWYDDVQDFIDSGEIGPVVVVGDSMVRLGNWNDILDEPAINRGIGGDTTALILERINDIALTAADTAYVFCGINDVYRGADTETSYVYYRQIIEALQSMGMTVTVISTLLCNPTLSAQCTIDKIQKVKALNNLMANISGITFIDANSVLSNTDSLKLEYTYDGVHLNADGYNALSALLTGT